MQNDCKERQSDHKKIQNSYKEMQNDHKVTQNNQRDAKQPHMKSTSKRHKMAIKRLCFFQSACLVLMQEGYRKLLSHNSTVAVVYEELQIANI